VAITLRWNDYVLPDGCELWEEQVRGTNRVRGYVGRIGGALSGDGGYEYRRIRVRFAMSERAIGELRGVVDDWQRQIGNDFGWLRQTTATMDRRIYCKPDDFEIDYPATVFDVAEITQAFIAPDPRWQSVGTSTQIILPPLRYRMGSARVDVDGSAEALTRLYWWPRFRALEQPGSVELTNRYANLLYNADLGIQTPLTTQDGLATPWECSKYDRDRYQPWMLRERARQYVDVDPGGTAQAWATAARIPYAPVRNATSPTTDTIVWGAHWALKQLTGDWRFYLRLHAVLGTAWGGGTANTVTSPVYGTTGAAVTVAGTNWSGRIAVTMTATGGLSPHVRRLQPEYVFVGATGAGTVGGGRIVMTQPYVRTDGGGYEYRPHRTVRWEGMGAYGRAALEADMSYRESWLFAESAGAATGNAYLTDNSAFWELAPGPNEIHVRIAMAGTQAVTAGVTTYPVSSDNLVFTEWTDRWWA